MARGDWFDEGRFGLFIHWGPYSLHGRCVWASYRERMPQAEYRELAERFTAEGFDADAWARQAVAAGARYLVFCSRQHPGFSLFDSSVSRFNATQIGPKRDLVAEYVDACRRHGLKVGLYYSLLDWRFPAYFDGPEKNPDGWAELVGYVHAQVREICTNYGPIDLLWYDGAWPWSAADWRSAELNRMVRELQPQIMINNRSGEPQDFGTPEQELSAAGGGRWESCITMNDHWAYSPEDDNWKSTRQLLHTLVSCVSSGGNLLLDVGPEPGGAIPDEAAVRLNAIGAWLARNGESIYGCGVSPFNDNARRPQLKSDTTLSKVGLVTAKAETLYLHVMHWPGREIFLANVGNRIRHAELPGGPALEVGRRDDRWVISGLPQAAPDRLDTVITVRYEDEPVALPHFRYIP